MTEGKQFESQPTLESRLIKALKEKGFGNPETRNLLEQWKAQEDEKIKADPKPGAHFDLELKRAQIWLQAGFIDEAIECLEGALMMAANEGEPEYWDEVNAELERLRNEP